MYRPVNKYIRSQGRAYVYLTNVCRVVCLIESASVRYDSGCYCDVIESGRSDEFQISSVTRHHVRTSKEGSAACLSEA